MATTRIALSENSREFIDRIFDEMMTDCPSITGLLISSVDGYAVISHFRSTLEASRLSAMTSSILALGESLSKEANQQLCRHIIVQNSEGVIVTQRFGRSLVLTAISDKNTNLGLLHSITRIGAGKLAEFQGQ